MLLTINIKVRCIQILMTTYDEWVREIRGWHIIVNQATREEIETALHKEFSEDRLIDWSIDLHR